MHQSVFNLSLLLSQYTGSKIFWSNIKHMDVKLYPFLRMERTLHYKSIHVCDKHGATSQIISKHILSGIYLWT